MLNPNQNPASPRRTNAVGTPTHVSEPAFEFLLHAMIEQIEIECHKEYTRKVQEMKESLEESNSNNNTKKDDNGKESDEKEDEVEKQKDGVKEDLEGGKGKDGDNTTYTQTPTEDNSNDNPLNTSINHQQHHQLQQKQAEEEEQKHKQKILMNENIAAKMERIGFDVGYRLVERLCQSKSLIPPSAHTKTPSQVQLQLEAVKFICKEFWTEIFRKQIDKLQTNHKGVFVLKDGRFKWLDRMPSDLDIARSMAIKILALPCGLIRGALSNLGIAAVVSCDFMDDGENMHSCSFNVKIK